MGGNSQRDDELPKVVYIVLMVALSLVLLMALATGIAIFLTMK